MSLLFRLYKKKKGHKTHRGSKIEGQKEIFSDVDTQNPKRKQQKAGRCKPKEKNLKRDAKLKTHQKPQRQKAGKKEENKQRQEVEGNEQHMRI